MDVTKPYEFIGSGAMDVTKPYEFIRFGASSKQNLHNSWASGITEATVLQISPVSPDEPSSGLTLGGGPKIDLFSFYLS